MAIVSTPRYDAAFGRNAAVIQPHAGGGQFYAIGGYVLLGTDFDDADIAPLIPLPSTMTVTDVKVWTDGASGGTAVVDIGLYTLSSDGDTATVVDDDYFDAGFDITTAAKNTSVIDGAVTVADMNQPLWEAAGLTAQPTDTLWLCLTGETADITAATAVFVQVEGFL